MHLPAPRVLSWPAVLGPPLGSTPASHPGNHGQASRAGVSGARRAPLQLSWSDVRPVLTPPANPLHQDNADAFSTQTRTRVASHESLHLKPPCSLKEAMPAPPVCVPRVPLRHAPVPSPDSRARSPSLSQGFSQPLLHTHFSRSVFWNIPDSILYGESGLHTVHLAILVYHLLLSILFVFSYNGRDKPPNQAEVKLPRVARSD